MPRFRRATLRGAWWTAYFTSIRHCYACGRKLARKYVKAEKRRRHVCTGCGTITYTNPKIVAGIIPVMSDGRVVLLKRNLPPAVGKWTYPAGFQELGESVDVAAVRETWEEIRARVKITGFVGLYSYPDAGVVTILYSGRVLPGEKPRAGEEADTVALFRPSELPWKDMAFRSTVEGFKDWKKQKRS